MATHSRTMPMLDFAIIFIHYYDGVLHGVYKHARIRQARRTCLGLLQKTCGKYHQDQINLLGTTSHISVKNPLQYHAHHRSFSFPGCLDKRRQW